MKRFRGRLALFDDRFRLAASGGFRWAVTSVFLLAAGSASGVAITADYASLGTIRLDAAGKVVTSGGTDVTAVWKQDVDTAIAYWQSAISKNWNITIHFSMADTGTDVGDALATAWLSTTPKHITEGNIRFNNASSTIKYFVDSTPGSNSEFSIGTANASLGGGSVNSKRLGNATEAGGAAGRWDVLTLALHEIEHLLGFASVAPIFTAAVSGPPNRRITVTTAVSGLTSDFDIPLVSGSAHIDGSASSGLFNDTVVADPGWSSGQRALVTGIDVLGVCQINQCTSSQYNLNPVPEPGTLWLLALGVAGFAARGRRGAEGRA